MCIVFKNPDAQKKQKWIKRDKALNMILKSFKILPQGTAIEQRKFRNAEIDAISEILGGIADSEQKVPLYQGGRF